MPRCLKNAVACLPLLLAAGCTTAPLGAIGTHPTSAILFIADGAGVGHWTLASFASDDLAVRRMPVAGLVDTRGSDHEVTGSAAGATAIATGVRTFRGAIAVGPDGRPRETVLEVAHAKGWATGLITTTMVGDATPASFAAHVPSRTQTVEIFRQMTDLPVHVILGGGTRLLDVMQERDGIDPRGALQERYTYVETARELRRASEGETTNLLGLFAPLEMPPATERSPSLEEMTEAALRVLARDPDGFFLMVETEGSDTYAHRNSPQEMITAEMLGLDAAIATALEYQKRHPGTLILVTADHETGGMYLPSDTIRRTDPSEPIRPSMVLRYGTRAHTAALVPLFAAGPGAERFGGLKNNEEVGRILLELVRGSSRRPGD